jgi:hypothetical protein
MGNRIARRRAQGFEVGRPSIGVFLFEPLLVGDRLLLHIFDIDRAAALIIARECLGLGRAAQHGNQQARQFHRIVDPAIETEAADRIVHMRGISGQECAPLTKLRRDALVDVVDVAMDDRIGAGLGKEPLQPPLHCRFAQHVRIALAGTRRDTRTPREILDQAWDEMPDA